MSSLTIIFGLVKCTESITSEILNTFFTDIFTNLFYYFLEMEMIFYLFFVDLARGSPCLIFYLFFVDLARGSPCLIFYLFFCGFWPGCFIYLLWIWPGGHLVSYFIYFFVDMARGSPCLIFYLFFVDMGVTLSDIPIIFQERMTASDCLAHPWLTDNRVSLIYAQSLLIIILL